VSNGGTQLVPGGLDLVIDFVNTRDLEEDTEELATPQALAAWLLARGLLARRATPPNAADRRRAVGLREALRALMLANSTGSSDEAALAELEQAASRGQLGVHFAADGSVQMTPASPGIDGALARLLVPVAAAIADGTWQRVKACQAEGCRYAFYDRSRNRAGIWCDMAVCGNRTKIRAYRARSAGKG
jgi:predicted RNA-binding Zn ribbon-like protein